MKKYVIFARVSKEMEFSLKRLAVQTGHKLQYHIEAALEEYLNRKKGGRLTQKEIDKIFSKDIMWDIDVAPAKKT